MYVFFFPLASGLVLALVAISCRLCTLGTNLSIKKKKKKKKVYVNRDGSRVLRGGVLSVPPVAHGVREIWSV